ncbi:hypothetical protein DPEC_G00250200 [Dallia pectoralis]|uniref:Uncharacterized protein n=1 Tax=Dallia pectoralis TaxID=75939 RepID=A0ACC2FT21_DALPE|nr:hypothetical protein DPEC_G00250200 [Dallia pectoralis]
MVASSEIYSDRKCIVLERRSPSFRPTTPRECPLSDSGGCDTHHGASRLHTHLTLCRRGQGEGSQAPGRRKPFAPVTTNHNPKQARRLLQRGTRVGPFRWFYDPGLNRTDTAAVLWPEVQMTQAPPWVVHFICPDTWSTGVHYGGGGVLFKRTPLRAPPSPPAPGSILRQQGSSPPEGGTHSHVQGED